MCLVAAGWVVALVANIQPNRNGTVLPLPGEAMRQHRLLTSPYPTVTSQQPTTNPLDAAGDRILRTSSDLEPLFKRQLITTWDMGITTTLEPAVVFQTHPVPMAIPIAAGDPAFIFHSLLSSGLQPPPNITD